MTLQTRLIALVFCCHIAGPTAAQPSSSKSIAHKPWQEAVVSVTKLQRTADFFTEIGGYQVLHRGAMTTSELAAWGLQDSAGGESMLLGPSEPGSNPGSGLVRLVRFDNAGPKRPMRPGARAWDTGCYFSIMIRMKNMQKIYDQAIALGWWTETPITDLTFGESKLNVVVYRGPDGVQVQGYERLQPPLPPAIGAFDSFTRPFNLMQTVRDLNTSYQFFSQILGFATFYKGQPYVAPKVQPSPLGIPLNLSTSSRYQAAIVYPLAGEFGRMEMVEFMDLDGNDYANRCLAPNLGILAVRYEVPSAQIAAATLSQRGWPLHLEPTRVELMPYGMLDLFAIRTPDGALMQFYSRGQAEAP